MGIKGISLGETKDIVSQYDKDEPKTIWKIGILNSDIYDFVLGQDNIFKIGAEAIRFGLRGFENFTVDGQSIKFDTISRTLGQYNYKVVADNIMKIIPPEIKSELGAEILKMSKVNEEEIKN